MINFTLTLTDFLSTSDTITERQTEKGKSIFIREVGERLERVQPTLAKEVPGSGVSMYWGKGRGPGPPTKASLPRTLWIPEDKVVLTVNAALKPHCLAPGRQRTARSEYMHECEGGNLFS